MIIFGCQTFLTSSCRLDQILEKNISQWNEGRCSDSAEQPPAENNNLNPPCSSEFQLSAGNDRNYSHFTKLSVPDSLDGIPHREEEEYSQTPAGPWASPGTSCTLESCCPASSPSAWRRADLQEAKDTHVHTARLLIHYEALWNARSWPRVRSSWNRLHLQPGWTWSRKAAGGGSGGASLSLFSESVT